MELSAYITRMERVSGEHLIGCSPDSSSAPSTSRAAISVSRIQVQGGSSVCPSFVEVAHPKAMTLCR